MDTRDRLEEVGKNRRKHGNDYTDNKSLLGDYISEKKFGRVHHVIHAFKNALLL